MPQEPKSYFSYIATPLYLVLAVMVGPYLFVKPQVQLPIQEEIATEQSIESIPLEVQITESTVQFIEPRQRRQQVIQTVEQTNDEDLDSVAIAEPISGPRPNPFDN